MNQPCAKVCLSNQLFIKSSLFQWVCLIEAQSLTFSEFLDKKGLTPNLMHFIITSIAMVASNSPAMEVGDFSVIFATLPILID